MDPARRVCRWRAPAASGGLGRATSTTCAAFLADRLAIGETVRGTGRTLTGGLDARTLEEPRRLFGAARKAEEGGSLTVIATALVDTGSRMDDVIFQEFKGTGNMELVLDRTLFEQRIYPAVDIPKSGTRKEEKLFSPADMPRVHRLRRALFEMKPKEAMQSLLGKLAKFPSNAAFLKAIDV